MAGHALPLQVDDENKSTMVLPFCKGESEGFLLILDALHPNCPRVDWVKVTFLSCNNNWQRIT